MNRKPYYILRLYSSFILHEGIGRDKYPYSGNSIQLYLTDEEYNRYDRNKLIELLKPYIEVTKRRYMYCPAELILYAIEKVIYERE